MMHGQQNKKPFGWFIRIYLNIFRTGISFFYDSFFPGKLFGHKTILWVYFLYN